MGDMIRMPFEETLDEYTKSYHNNDEYTRLFYVMDSTMKYIHGKGYYVINFNPKIYNYFKKTSVLKALVTLASPQYTNELQSKLKLKEFYSEILYVKDFKSYNKKDCYKKIAKDFNIDFAEICVMGDSYINDILPAQELGCKVILISNKSRNSNIKTVESIEEFIENGGIEKYYE